MEWLLVIVFGIIMLTVLVVVHEAGHFLAARAFGVRVTEFMIGLPGPSIGFTHKDTRFGLTALPFGGYARVCGMDIGEEDPHLADALAFVYRQGTTDALHLAAALDVDEDEADSLLVILSDWGSITTPRGSLTADTYLACPRDGFGKGQPREVTDPAGLLERERLGTYHHLSFWKRVVVLAAGALMNLLLAVIIFVILYSVHGVYVTDNSIYDVVEGSPAAEAGLQAGDRIVAIDGTQTLDWDTLSGTISSHSSGDTVDVTYERGGETLDADVTLYTNSSGATAMGFYAGSSLVHYSVWESLGEGFSYIGLVAQAVGKLFVPTMAMETLDQSASVVGIAFIAKSAADSGPLSFMLMGAALSVSLGLMNLLPIPPLDGGRIFVEIIQRIRRRDISAKVYSVLTGIGISLFALLFIYLLVQDFGRYVIGG